MIVYILGFCITLLLVSFINKRKHNKYIINKRKHNKYIGFLSLLIAALPLSILAGCRDTSVGTDTEFYGVPCYNMIVHYGELGFIMGASEWEPAFTLCIYLGNLYNNTLNAGLFLTQFWILSFAFSSIYLLRDKLNLVFGVSIYLLLFYNPSLNLMRQSMAMSVCMLSWAFLYKRKPLWCIALMILGFFCHKTCIFFSLPLLLFYGFSRNTVSVLTRKMIYILAPIAVIMYSAIVGLFIKLGALSDHFLAYVDSSETSFSKTNVLSTLIIFLFVIQYARNRKNKLQYGEYSKLTAYLAFVLMFCSLVNMWAFRISFYFMTLLPLLMPLLSGNVRRTKRRQLNISFITFLFFFWFWDVVINGSNSTYPYTSVILGIR